MEFLQEYESTKRAFEITGIQESGIRRVARGEGNVSDGYKWIYKNN